MDQRRFVVAPHFAASRIWFCSVPKNFSGYYRPLVHRRILIFFLVWSQSIGELVLGHNFNNQFRKLIALDQISAFTG